MGKQKKGEFCCAINPVMKAMSKSFWRVYITSKLTSSWKTKARLEMMTMITVTLVKESSWSVCLKNSWSLRRSQKVLQLTGNLIGQVTLKEKFLGLVGTFVCFFTMTVWCFILDYMLSSMRGNELSLITFDPMVSQWQNYKSNLLVFDKVYRPSVFTLRKTQEG